MTANSISRHYCVGASVTEVEFPRPRAVPVSAPNAEAPDPQRVSTTDTASEAGNRGTLRVNEKAAQRLAIRAAVDTPHVLSPSGGRSAFAGRTLPQARVTVTGDRVRADLKITVAWPAPAAQVARAVQRNVAAALTAMAGLHVDGVDVSVQQSFTPSVGQRRVQ